MSVSCAAVLSLALSASPEFSATFGREALNSYLEAKDSVVLASAGADSVALAEAAAALETSLRGAGNVDLVLDSKTLGPVATLDDPAIVKRCAELPVKHVIVLRVFERPNRPARAVATIYDKQGSLVTAFSAEAGSALAARSAPSAAQGNVGNGVNQAAAKAVLETVSATSNAGAQQKYDEQYLDFEDWSAVNQTGVMLRWSEPYQGKYRKRIEFEEYYKLVERPDLASAYNRRAATRTGLIVGGVVVAVGSLAIGLAASGREDCSINDPGFSSCIDRNREKGQTAAAVGLAGSLVGCVAALAGWAIDPQPVEPSEARRLADMYNTKLKSQLGLAAAPAARVEKSNLRLELKAFETSAGGGLLLLARF